MPLEIKNRFITPDDILTYFGVDLKAELPDNQAEALIMRTEDRIEAFLQANFFRRVDYDNMSDTQKTFFRKALMEQVFYVFKNGDISVDSGFDFEKGVITDNSILLEKSIAPNAVQYLVLCGLWTRHIGGRC